MKDEPLHIWTWIATWNESSFNISCQSVTILKRWSDWQISIIITIHNCWKWRRLILCWLNWQHEIKHEICTIWTSDQMRRIQTKNMRIIHNNKKKCINFDKRISWRSFFMICLSWMNKRRELMIIFWYMIYEMNHKHTIHEDRKNMKHCWSWITYEHEHELDFDHNQNHVRNHDVKYEISEISDVDREYCNRIDLISRYDDSVKHLSWISISRLATKIDERDQKNQYWQEKSS